MKARKKLKRLKAERAELRARVAELEQQLDRGLAVLQEQQEATAAGLAAARAEYSDVELARAVLEALVLLQPPPELRN